VTLSLSGAQESIPRLLKSLQIRDLDAWGRVMENKKAQKVSEKEYILELF
jgi:hypothetical protein